MKPTSKANLTNVNDYIAAQPKATRLALAQVRRAIRNALPKAEEVISYKMPACKLNGSIVVYFAGWKEHYSLYPAGERLVAAFKDELAPYKVSKGTIRFPLSEPVPGRLIERLAKFRATEANNAKNQD